MCGKMTKEVSIKIKGVQQYPEGEKLETVTEVPAEYYLRNDTQFVIYEESEAGFTENSKCMLKIREDSVELTKKGLIQSHMVFQKGKLHMTEYRTPFGMVLLGVNTKHIRIQKEENSLTIQIAYALEADGAPMAECDIHMIVKNA